MNWAVIAGNWKQFKGQVKEKWGKLTDDNLDTIAGKRGPISGNDPANLRRYEGSSRGAGQGIRKDSQGL